VNSSPESKTPAQRQRRYRDKPSHPLPVWNGILEHLPNMGMSIWPYLWCLDRITYEQDGIGHVLGGAPVKVERIAEELGRSARALRRDFKRLRSRYLHLRWTPFGYVIEVLNSRKFGIWKPLNSPATIGEARDKSGEARTKNGQAVTENGRSKEDAAVAAVDAAVEQQPAAALTPNPENSVWDFLGIKPCGPNSFRTLLESGWASRNGDPYSTLIGETVDGWKAAEGKLPPRCAPLFRALDGLRRRERQEGHPPDGATQPIHIFSDEEIPA
jgi:hypothetical protein